LRCRGVSPENQRSRYMASSSSELNPCGELKRVCSVADYFIQKWATHRQVAVKTELTLESLHHRCRHGWLFEVGGSSDFNVPEPTTSPNVLKLNALFSRRLCVARTGRRGPPSVGSHSRTCCAAPSRCDRIAGVSEHNEVPLTYLSLKRVEQVARLVD
jgi:hypothetical protein